MATKNQTTTATRTETEEQKNARREKAQQATQFKTSCLEFVKIAKSEIQLLSETAQTVFASMLKNSSGLKTRSGKVDLSLELANVLGEIDGILSTGVNAENMNVLQLLFVKKAKFEKKIADKQAKADAKSENATA